LRRSEKIAGVDGGSVRSKRKHAVEDDIALAIPGAHPGASFTKGEADELSSW
jgi:hypothetical protein